MIEPITRTSLYQEAAERIQAHIQSAAWPPGSRIPSERELAKALNIGRSSIREALRVLQANDLIEIRPGEGTFVKQRGSPLSGERLRSLLYDRDIADLYEARELLDVQIAALAAQRATAEDIRAIETTLERMAEGIEQGRCCVQEDFEFHMALTEAADNPVLAQIQELLLKRVEPAVRQFLQVPGRLERSLAEHRAVLEAIRVGDAVASRQLMHTHLQSRFTDPAVAKVFKELDNTVLLPTSLPAAP
jgi:GntR family transcriptional repressor for pyruvate dehydrogenase complex